MTDANIDEILDLMQSQYGHVNRYANGTWVREPFETENVKPLSKAKRGDISFCSLQGDDAVKAVMASKATYIVCSKGIDNEPGFLDWSQQPPKMLIFVENPRLWYMRMLKHFNNTFRDVDRVNINTSSDIDDTVMVHGDVVIGADCDIDPYVVIGGDGFGYERNEHGVFEKFPHLGGVRIRNDVDIGAHTAIDRATLPNEYTYIHDGVKIDNFVHVAHNVEIGDDTLIVSHTNLGGSVKIGRACWLGMSVCILNGVKIGNNCVIGNRANIRKDVPDGSVVIGDDEIIGHVNDKEKWKRMVGPLV